MQWNGVTQLVELLVGGQGTDGHSCLIISLKISLASVINEHGYVLLSNSVVVPVWKDKDIRE